MKAARSRRCVWPWIMLMVCASIPAYADTITCGDPFTNHFGPWDYYTARAEDRETVEHFHFTPQVEELKSGQSAYIGQDLSYTLNVFPNHPRALLAMSRLAIREKTSTPGHASRSIECWFDRAIRFRPEDATVRLIYGIHLINTGKVQDAVEQLELARKLGGANANVEYNLGLAYFDLGRYDESLAHAQAAYRLGFPLPGLRNKLEKAGKWKAAASTTDSSEAEGQGSSTNPRSEASRESSAVSSSEPAQVTAKPH